MKRTHCLRECYALLPPSGSGDCDGLTTLDLDLVVLKINVLRSRPEAVSFLPGENAPRETVARAPAVVGISRCSLHES